MLSWIDIFSEMDDILKFLSISELKSLMISRWMKNWIFAFGAHLSSSTPLHQHMICECTYCNAFNKTYRIDNIYLCSDCVSIIRRSKQLTE